MFSSEKETRCPKKTRCPKWTQNELSWKLTRCPKVGQMPETGQMPQSGPDAPTRTHYASFIVLSKTVLCILSKLHFLNSVTHLGCLFEFNTEYRLMWKHRPFTPNHTDSQLKNHQESERFSRTKKPSLYPYDGQEVSVATLRGSVLLIALRGPCYQRLLTV